MATLTTLSQDHDLGHLPQSLWWRVTVSVTSEGHPCLLPQHTIPLTSLATFHSPHGRKWSFRLWNGCSLGPLPQQSCSLHQPGWNQLHADVRDSPHTHQTHTLKVNFKVWAGCPGYLPLTLSPHPGTPSDAFPSFSFLYMQMRPFPWAMSALPFSREASLCLATSFWCQKGLEEGGGRANDSEGKIEWELCPKIWFCYTDSTVGFIPNSFSQLICLQTQKHSISEPSSAERKDITVASMHDGCTRQGCQCIWN